MPDDKSKKKQPERGIGLCLSGGGYRATLFHLGALWRLNEFGYLPKIERYSSVSGGSIIAGWLGFVWHKLDFDGNGKASNFEDEVINPIRKFATLKLDVGIVLKGLLNPFRSSGDMLVSAYRKHLFGDATLQDLPDKPDFVFDASNAQSGVLWGFSKGRMGDYRVGYVYDPTIELSVAVAASSAFPPVLSPIILRLKESDFRKGSGDDLRSKPFRTNVMLMDGGVYDNMGLEPVIKRYQTVLVSDAGGKMKPVEKPRQFWGFQAFRLMSLMDNQVRALRKRQIIGMFKDEQREGTYWGIYSDMDRYGVKGALEAPESSTVGLAGLPTRLWTFSNLDQERLINWGYAICDAAMRKHVDQDLPEPTSFPYKVGVA